MLLAVSFPHNCWMIYPFCSYFPLYSCLPLPNIFPSISCVHHTRCPLPYTPTTSLIIFLPLQYLPCLPCLYLTVSSPHLSFTSHNHLTCSPLLPLVPCSLSLPFPSISPHISTSPALLFPPPTYLPVLPPSPRPARKGQGQGCAHGEAAEGARPAG